MIADDLALVRNAKTHMVLDLYGDDTDGIEVPKEVWAACQRITAECERLRGERTALFQTGDFTLSSGAKSTWKIECDALTPADWDGLAAIAAERLPKFVGVLGVPRGGIPFAKALDSYVRNAEDDCAAPVLIAEDVVTTGGSMERFRAKVADLWPGREFIGVCAFARGSVPSWVTPLFQLRSQLAAREPCVKLLDEETCAANPVWEDKANPAHAKPVRAEWKHGTEGLHAPTTDAEEAWQQIWADGGTIRENLTRILADARADATAKALNWASSAIANKIGVIVPGKSRDMEWEAKLQSIYEEIREGPRTYSALATPDREDARE